VRKTPRLFWFDCARAQYVLESRFPRAPGDHYRCRVGSACAPGDDIRRRYCYVAFLVVSRARISVASCTDVESVDCYCWRRRLSWQRWWRHASRWVRAMTSRMTRRSKTTITTTGWLPVRVFFLKINDIVHSTGCMQLDQHRHVGQKQGLKRNSGNDKNPSAHVKICGPLSIFAAGALYF